MADRKSHKPYNSDPKAGDLSEAEVEALIAGNLPTMPENKQDFVDPKPASIRKSMLKSKAPVSHRKRRGLSGSF